MNPITFSEILSDLPDEFIESAAEPHSKPVRWYQISAVAACVVLMISAVIYPRLRTPKPETVEPPVSIFDTTETVTTAPEQSDDTEYRTGTAPPQTGTARTTSAGTQTVTAQSGTAGTTGTTIVHTQVTAAITTANHTTGTRKTTGAHASATRSTTHSSTRTQTNSTVRTTVQSTGSEVTSQSTVCFTDIGTNPTSPCTTRISTTTVMTWTTAPEPRTLTVPVYKQPYDPLTGRRTDPPPVIPEYGVTIMPGDTMQQIYHWSPPGIRRINDYDYLQIHIYANATDAALLHAEYASGEWVITVGLQSEGAGIYLDQIFLLPVPKDMNVIPRQCRVEFQSVAVADQPSEIEMNIH